MSRLERCRYFLLRWQTDAVKGEFVNFAVALTREGEAGEEFVGLRMTKDWGRVKRLDPEADIEVLQAFEGEMERFASDGESARRWLLERMKETFSLSVQASEARCSLADDAALELERLAEAYLETKRTTDREATGRVAIHRAMRREFEKQGVWALMRKNIAAAEYTQKGDPLKIDCGYRPNGCVHMFHALSIEADANAAKAVAWSFPRMRAGMERIEGARAELTAIVEESESETAEFARKMLNECGVATASTAQLPELAARARRDMKLG